MPVDRALVFLAHRVAAHVGPSVPRARGVVGSPCGEPVVVGPFPHSCSSPHDCMLGLCLFCCERERTYKCPCVRFRRESRKATPAHAGCSEALPTWPPWQPLICAVTRLWVCFRAPSVPLGYVLMTLSLLCHFLAP